MKSRDFFEGRKLNVISGIEGSGAFAVHDQFALRHQLFDGGFHGGFAQGRAQFHEVRFCDFSHLTVGGPADCFKGGEFCSHQLHPFLKFPVGGQNGAQEIFDKGGGVFLPLVPALLTPLQSVIIEILILGNLALQRDILSHHIAAAIEQKRSQQTAHAAIAVIEGVDAKKVVDEHRNEDQGVQFLGIQSPGEALTDGVDGPRSFIGGEGSKQHHAVSLGIGGGDIVLGTLEGAADPFFGILVEIPMKLKDIV